MKASPEKLTVKYCKAKFLTVRNLGCMLGALRRLLEISEIERILSKSKLSEERTREISLSLANEYERLYKGLEG